jgi:hypothetical protein
MQGDNISKAKFFEERARRTKNVDRRGRYMKAAERYRLAARNEKQSEPQRAGMPAHVIEMDA